MRPTAIIAVEPGETAIPASAPVPIAHDGGSSEATTRSALEARGSIYPWTWTTAKTSIEAWATATDSRTTTARTDTEPGSATTTTETASTDTGPTATEPATAYAWSTAAESAAKTVATPAALHELDGTSRVHLDQR